MGNILPSRRWDRLLAALLALVLTAIVATGCSSSKSSSGGGGGANAKSHGKVSLGIVGYSGADATLNKTAQEIVKQAKALGWTTNYQADTPAGSVQNANQLMNVMILKGATMLMTLAFDPTQLGAGMAAARAKNIPVLAVSAGKLAPGVIWASNVGYIPDMGKLIESEFGGAGKATGEILNLTYLLATPGQGRNQLIKDVAKQNPGLHLTNQEVVIPGAVQSGRDFTVAWLASHPPKPGVRLGIYAVFDQPAQGAVAALKQANRRDVKIYSYDATPAGLSLVENGYINGDVQNGRVAQATQAIAAAKQVAAGTLTKPTLVPAAYFIVTPANVAQYKKDHPAAFTSEGI